MTAMLRHIKEEIKGPRADELRLREEKRQMDTDQIKYMKELTEMPLFLLSQVFLLFNDFNLKLKISHVTVISTY